MKSEKKDLKKKRNFKNTVEEKSIFRFINIKQKKTIF